MKRKFTFLKASGALFGLFLSLSASAQVFMQPNGHTTVTCGGNTQFFDSGGSSGNYPPNANLIHKFCPSDTSRILRVRLLSYALADQNAFLVVYDGDSTDASVTGADASSSFIVTSSKKGGCLTFRFFSGSATPLAGWQALLSCIAAVNQDGPVWQQPIESLQSTNVGAAPVSTCGGTFTDDGGLAASYSANAQGVYRTFCPDSAGKCMKITFNAPFGLQGTPPNSCVDVLAVRNGPTQNSAVIANLCGNTVPAPIISTDASGCLTFQFFSDGLTNMSGWNASLECVPCQESQQTEMNNSDCINAVGFTGPFSLCSDSVASFSLPGIGPGLVCEGAGGCVVAENYTAWFRMRTMSAGKMQFLITPTDANDDYDFAVYGPFPPDGGCGNLGIPIRCSYAANVGPTGLTETALDISEDINGNGFVSGFDAGADEDYLLMVNRWNPGSLDFSLTVKNCQQDPQYVCFSCDSVITARPLANKKPRASDFNLRVRFSKPAA